MTKNNLGKVKQNLVYAKTEEEMQCFDRLSKRLRSVLNKAPFMFSSREVYESIQAGVNESTIVQRIKNTCLRVFNEKPYGE